MTIAGLVAMARTLAKGRPHERCDWSERFAAVRAATRALTAGLTAEDQTIQSMPDVSPTKWHLGHTTWFFETFLLVPFLESYAVFDKRFGYLFNSYYESAGARHPRSERGLLSRPDVATVLAYREHVDRAMETLISGAPTDTWMKIRDLIELGLNHEEQHQELILMDIKHVFSVNPLNPVFAATAPCHGTISADANWIEYPGGLYEIGHEGAGFAFDNETPRHKIWLQPFAVMNRLLTCGEYLAFIADGGYSRPEFWLSDGWAMVQAEGWQAPLYWASDPIEDRTIFTLGGLRRVEAAEPVCHVSYYEADAYARWAGKRLPSEAEWEVAAARMQSGAELKQMFGDAWQWTQSPYIPYPRFRPAAGAVGEYNGKFMSGQMVLRGGSPVTPRDHTRATYRNFFPPSARWAFSGIRLADDV